MPGKLTLMWRRMNAAELGKDVVLVPGYLGRMLGIDVDIVCSCPDDVSRQAAAMGVGIVQRPMSFKKALRIPVNVCYLLANARRIDVLMCFHWRLETIINVLLYKFLNPRGKVYVKLDTANGNEFDNPSKKQLFAKALSKVDVMSCELSWVYDKLLANSAYGDILRDRLVYVPNGFDEDRLQAMLPQLASLKKENIILCVGRAGAHQKNMEMLLEVSRGLDLKDWKIMIAGSCTEQFRSMAADCPVELLGEVNDKQALWSLYARARVFVCTSRWESYGIVLREAQRFGCYIVSTDVGAAKDILQHADGRIIDSCASLRSALEELICNGVPAGGFDAADDASSYSAVLRPLVKYLAK